MTACPNCEYHKNRAARWRAEAYKQAGHDVIELPWVGLTDLQKGVIKFNHSKVGMMLITEYDLDAMLEATEQALKEKNT